MIDSREPSDVSSPIVAVERISKSYKRGAETLLVLDSISLNIRSGEFVALMGPSGSGKTSLLNLIAGLDKPDSGTITVQGSDITRLSESQLAAWRARSIGFVFQFYNLLPVLSALENVALPLSLVRMSRKERADRAKFALEIVGLGDRLHHYPSQLSGGQEQRVAIARAIVTDPSIIVADEPTGDLDRKSADDVMNLIARLNGEFSKTVVMVTHDQSVAGFARKTVMLDKGRIPE